MATDHIHPIFDRMLGRDSKEERLGQKGHVIWMYGLSGSGKSTLAIALERRLAEEGLFTQILDGDNIRSGLNQNLGFSDEDRLENIRRIAEVARLFAHAGVVTIASFITPREELRAMTREIIGEEDLSSIYVRASFETCAQRDPKGLYAKMQAGKIQQFTGKDSAFEEPADPVALIIDTEAADLDACLDQLHTLISPRIRR